MIVTGLGLSIEKLEKINLYKLFTIQWNQYKRSVKFICFNYNYYYYLY